MQSTDTCEISDDDKDLTVPEAVTPGNGPDKESTGLCDDIQPKWLNDVGPLSVLEDGNQPVLAPDTPFHRLRSLTASRRKAAVGIPQTPTRRLTSKRQQSRTCLKMV